MLKRILLGSALLAIVCSSGVMAQDHQVADGPEDHGKPAFSDIDTNKDGVISKSEFDAFTPKPPMHSRHGDWKGHGHEGRKGPPDFKTLDANGDGKVTFEEFVAPMKARFEHLDKNHDGVLEPDELLAHPSPDEDGPPPPPPVN